MRHLYKAFYGALLVLGLAGVTPIPALAGGHHWDAACHCRRPDSQYTTRHYVRAPARVITHRRVVTRHRVVRRTRLVQENRVIVHVRPVINRWVVVHRSHIIVRHVVLHRVNVINRYRNVYYNQVVNVDGGATVQHVTEYRNVNCYRDYARGIFRGGRVVSYRY
jgi:hypothetical protein